MDKYLTRDRKLEMLTDFYEFTMSNGYLACGLQDRQATFDAFFRRCPDGGGFVIFAGLEQLMEYLSELSFSAEDIEYFRGKGCFSEEFLKYLSDFEFSCDVWSLREGTPAFPREPMVIVKGPLAQVQMIETMLLLTVNFQSLIATKTNRIVRAAQGRPVLEFGSRRAQSYDAANLGARAAYIAGAAGTADTLADICFGIPASGTMAHSWVQVFDTEYDAFKHYAECYPDNCCLLVDTYNVLKSGVPNAIKVFNDIILPKGFRPKSIRIDSGDLAYLSKKARKMLDDAGFPDVQIVASNSLDEYIIRDLLIQGAKLDCFGVGENLITSKSEPVFGGVYKLTSAENAEGVLEPKIKVSETVEKITIPAFKDLYRFYDIHTGKALADYITVKGETVDDSGNFTIFDPNEIWKKKTLYDFRAESLLVQVFDHGKPCYQTPSVPEIRKYCSEQLDTIWDEVKRFEYPHTYYVDLSQKLWDIRSKLLEEHSADQ